MTKTLSRAERIRRANTVTVETPGGGEYLMRRPKLVDLAESGFAVPLSDDAETSRRALAKRQQEIQNDPAQIEAMGLDLYRRLGLDPLLHEGDGDCPEDRVTAADMGPDILYLLTWALDCLGFSEMREGAKEAERFPGDE